MSPASTAHLTSMWSTNVNAEFFCFFLLYSAKNMIFKFKIDGHQCCTACSSHPKFESKPFVDPVK